MFNYLALGLLVAIVLGCAPEPPVGNSDVEPLQQRPDFIDGQVHSMAGQPEAGVWVIAETAALPTPSSLLTRKL